MSTAITDLNTYTLNVYVDDDKTRENLRNGEYRLRIGDPDPEYIDGFRENPPAYQTAEPSVGYEFPLQVTFSIPPASAAQYRMGIMLSPNSTPTQLFPIEFGDIYVLNDNGVGSVITPTRKPSWVPSTGFGFQNSVTAAPVLFLGPPPKPSDPPERPLPPLQPLWVPGAGRIEPPPAPLPDREVVVWFESKSKPGAIFKTGDQSRVGEMTWNDDVFDEDDEKNLKIHYWTNGEFKGEAEPKKGSGGGVTIANPNANANNPNANNPDANAGGDPDQGFDHGQQNNATGDGQMQRQVRLAQAPPAGRVAQTAAKMRVAMRNGV